jgi:hypothetical protein
MSEISKLSYTLNSKTLQNHAKMSIGDIVAMIKPNDTPFENVLCEPQILNQFKQFDRSQKFKPIAYERLNKKASKSLVFG